MPRSDAAMRGAVTTDSSWNTPTATNTGASCAMLVAGLALWATTQMLQVAASVALGCVWVDSTAAVHNIKDKQNHADQRTHKRMNFPALGLDSFQLITVICETAMPDKLL